MRYEVLITSGRASLPLDFGAGIGNKVKEI